MVNDIHDVYTGQMQGVDPEQLQRIARAKSAQGQVSGMSNSPAMQAALRDYNMAPLEVRGQGAAATAPHLLEGVARAVTRNQGKSKLAEMELQSQALRGQISEGSMAEQRAQLQAQDYQNKIDSQQRAQAVTDSQAAATLANERAVARETTEANYLVAEPQEYTHPKTGERVLVGRTRGGGMINPDTNEKISIEGLRKTSDMQNEALAGVQGIANMSNTHKTDVVGSYEGIRALNKIGNTASQLSDAGRAQIDNVTMNAVLKAVTPKAFEELIKGKRFTPEVKKYLQEVNEFSVKLRNQYFGSALTMNEQQIAEAFLPSATGISLADQMARIDGLARTYGDSLKSIDQLYGSNTATKAPDYTPWTDKKSQEVIANDRGGLSVDEAAELAALTKRFEAEKTPVNTNNVDLSSMQGSFGGQP